MKVYFVMGITNSGKSHFIERCLELNGVAACQVGKEFRRRYPPGHFKGQGAPTHTEQEALNILDEQIKEATGAKVLLIDGQPRTVSQVDTVVAKVCDLSITSVEALIFHADELTIAERAESRNPDAEGLALSLARMKNDRVQLYDVILGLIAQDVPITVWYPKEVNELFTLIKEDVDG